MTSQMTRLNESFYQWVCPIRPKLDIIFFHDLNLDGCKNVHLKTWEIQSTSSTPIYWPQTWLQTEFPHARILCARYFTGATMNLYCIGENFMHDFISRSYAESVQNRPVCMVGHGFGGLVIKELICRAQQSLSAILEPQVDSANAGWKLDPHEVPRLQGFINNIEGVFYYGTPFHGTALAKHLPESPLVSALKVHNPKTSILNEQFRKWKEKKGCKTSYILPRRLTKLKIGIIPTYHQVTEEGSGRYDVDSFYSSTDDDHLNVTKPGDKKSCSFYRLVEFITIICHETESCTLSANDEKEYCKGRVEEILVFCKDQDSISIREDLLDKINMFEDLVDNLKSGLTNLGFKFDHYGVDYTNYSRN